MNIEALKAKIKESGYDNKTVAEKIGMAESTLYRKINSQGDNFTVKEVEDITNLLGLSYDEALLIFFNKSLA